MSFFAVTVKTPAGFAFQQVWMVAGLATGTLLLVSPLIGAELVFSDPAGLDAAAPTYAGLLARLASRDQFAALCFVLMLLAATQIVLAFFTAAGAHLLTLDLVHHYMLPDLGAEGRRLAARVVLAILYTVALLGALMALPAVILSSVALGLSVQLLPAYLGLCWAPWISRSAVLTGLIFGGLFVIFTEPPGLILFAGLFAELPWGRWPLRSTPAPGDWHSTSPRA